MSKCYHNIPAIFLTCPTTTSKCYHTFLQFFLPQNNREILRMNHQAKNALQLHISATTVFLQFFWLALQPHLSATTTFLQFFWLALQPHLSATTRLLQIFLPHNNWEIIRMNNPVKIALQLCLSATTATFLQFFWNISDLPYNHI